MVMGMEMGDWGIGDTAGRVGLGQSPAGQLCIHPCGCPNFTSSGWLNGSRVGKAKHGN